MSIIIINKKEKKNYFGGLSSLKVEDVLQVKQWVLLNSQVIH